LTARMDFRNATLDDVEAVVALVESAYRGDASRAGWTTEADLLEGQRTDPDEVRDALPHLVIATDGEDLLGCCVLTPKGDHAYFGMFAVRPGLQGAGTGSALLSEAERRARDAGLAYVEMTVLSLRAELIDFYVRRGYADTGATRPFPYGDERFGKPQRQDLLFTVLVKRL
jgi:GNAT superfamily N-acetyltransferase